MLLKNFNKLFNSFLVPQDFLLPLRRPGYGKVCGQSLPDLAATLAGMDIFVKMEFELRDIAENGFIFYY
jgi:hypothetical protein